jgi:hypothetical protein
MREANIQILIESYVTGTFQKKLPVAATWVRESQPNFCTDSPTFLVRLSALNRHHPFSADLEHYPTEYQNSRIWKLECLLPNEIFMFDVPQSLRPVDECGVLTLLITDYVQSQRVPSIVVFCYTCCCLKKKNHFFRFSKHSDNWESDVLSI